MIDFTKFMSELREFDALRDGDEIQIDTVDSIQPQHAHEWPTELHTSVRNVLINAGIPKPYQHQDTAIRKSLSGADVVLESPTASGKTLAFTTPMLDTLIRNPDSHALMIYPMKALAFDQRQQIDGLCEPLGIESFPYDGDTDELHRKLLRDNPPQILLTNPEYLNLSFLQWRGQWEGFLRNLKYVVIDEMHEYRGFFGGNVALLLRRFFLHLNRIGVSPRVFLSTATCANPVEHAKNLTERDIELVSAKSALRPRRHFLFINPDIPDYRYWEILRLRVEQAALTVLTEGLQTLIFCPTKRFLEESYRNCRNKTKENGLDPERISMYHADIKSDDRRDIQQKIKAGDIDVIFTTNALELGIDIGGLDGIILAGFPSNIMSAWQQIGRAGRSWDKEAFVLFYAMNDPIDRFFVGNLEAFLNKSFDELVVDPSNEGLIENHLAALAAETDGELSSMDANILGRTFYDVAKKDMGTVPKGFRPHLSVMIRGNLGQSYELKRGDEKLGQVSAMRRFRETYIGAIFTLFGRKYSVHSHEADAVVLADADPNLRTEASFYTVLTQADIFDGMGYGDFEVCYGAVNFAMNFAGYEVIDERTDEIKEVYQATEAHYLNNLQAFWVNMEPNESATDGVGALEHLIRVGAMFVIPADRFDTGTYSKISDAPVAYYYENHPGGIGVAKKLYVVLTDVLEKGIEIAANCKCPLGCQNCIEPAKSYNISNMNIDKVKGIELATNLLEAIRKGPDRKFRNGRMISI